ncbi:MAG: 16S rRNA (uracil(1498)-N(3))-methyltransferase [Bryobacterales bacterium]|nr:16S rRNA (uracil(1498)-N(3))-methyltransferase [Bryobacterales bacterium]
MARRLFFVEEVHSGRAEIKGDEAGHLTRVLRVEKGHRYEISDNQQLYLAEVEVARKEHVVFQVLEKLPPRPLPVRVHLLAALIKFDHFEWMLEKATELGVERVTPIAATRSEHGLDKAAFKRSERWRKILKESAQQCRRAHLPALGPVASWKHVPAVEEGLRLLLDEAPGTSPLLRALPTPRLASDCVQLLVGPEGGWTDDERAAFGAAGWQAVSLGPLVLRAETAAISGLSIIGAAWL